MEITYFNFNSTKKYKFGCIISFYNRKDFVLNTFESLNNSFLPDNLLFIIIDDGSSDQFPVCLNHDYILVKKKKNYGISHSLVVGWDLINLLNIEYFINLDSDVKVSSNWISALFNAHSLHSKLNSNFLATGFNGVCHKVKQKKNNYSIKQTIGGVNLFFSKSMYTLVRKSLTSLQRVPVSVDEILDSLELYGSNPKLHPVYTGWDWALMSICEKEKIDLICTSPSIVQHVGSYGLTSSPNFTEVSLDFKDECVPKVIHQTWKDEQLPEHLKLMQETVIQAHRDYEYKFWTDKDLELFLKQVYPKTFEFYETNFPYVIQKIDFVRLLLLYHFGGVYIDIDSMCIKSVDSLLKYPCTLVSTERHNSFSKKHYPIVLNNAFMASEKGNAFLREVIISIIEYTHPEDYSEYCYLDTPYAKVLKTCGPLCITDCYLLYRDKCFVNLVSNNFYYGIQYDKNLVGQEVLNYSKEVLPTLEDAHFLHMHESSWYWSNNKKGLPNRNSNYVFDKSNSIKQKAKLEILGI